MQQRTNVCIAYHLCASIAMQPKLKKQSSMPLVLTTALHVGHVRVTDDLRLRYVDRRLAVFKAVSLVREQHT